MQTHRYRSEQALYGYWSVIDVFTGEVVVVNGVWIEWLEDEDEADDIADFLNDKDERRRGIRKET